LIAGVLIPPLGWAGVILPRVGKPNDLLPLGVGEGVFKTGEIILD